MVSVVSCQTLYFIFRHPIVMLLQEADDVDTFTSCLIERLQCLKLRWQREVGLFEHLGLDPSRFHCKNDGGNKAAKNRI